MKDERETFKNTGEFVICCFGKSTKSFVVQRNIILYIVSVNNVFSFFIERHWTMCSAAEYSLHMKQVLKVPVGRIVVDLIINLYCSSVSVWELVELSNINDEWDLCWLVFTSGTSGVPPTYCKVSVVLIDDTPASRPSCGSSNSLLTSVYTWTASIRNTHDSDPHLAIFRHLTFSFLVWKHWRKTVAF